MATRYKRKSVWSPKLAEFSLTEDDFRHLETECGHPLNPAARMSILIAVSMFIRARSIEDSQFDQKSFQSSVAAVEKQTQAYFDKLFDFTHLIKELATQSAKIDGPAFARLRKFSVRSKEALSNLSSWQKDLLRVQNDASEYFDITIRKGGARDLLLALLVRTFLNQGVKVTANKNKYRSSSSFSKFIKALNEKIEPQYRIKNWNRDAIETAVHRAKDPNYTSSIIAGLMNRAGIAQNAEAKKALIAFVEIFNHLGKSDEEIKELVSIRLKKLAK